MRFALDEAVFKTYICNRQFQRMSGSTGPMADRLSGNSVCTLHNIASIVTLILIGTKYKLYRLAYR